MRKLHAVHAAWHVDIGKEHADVGPRLQDFQCLVGPTGLDCTKTRIFDHIDCHHAQEWIILHDQYDMFGEWLLLSHRLRYLLQLNQRRCHFDL